MRISAELAVPGTGDVRPAPATGPPAAGPQRCAPASERRGEPLAGTARPGSRWLLIEDPGPWGDDVPNGGGLPADIAAALATRIARARLRLLLIRRPGRPDPHRPVHRWAFVDSRPGREGIWWGRWSAPAALLDLPLHPPADRPPSREPTYVVCVNGRRDPCCAIRGRPVAAALAATRPRQTWECSHIGGDRFAANLVALPYGMSYGRLEPATAGTVAAAYEAGRVAPAWLRGRTCLPPVVQAAQHHARLALHEDGLDALPAHAATALDARTWRVRLGRPGGDVLVHIRTGSTPPTNLGCSRPDLEPAPTFDLLDLATAN